MGSPQSRERGQKLRDRLAQQREERTPTVKALGLSPESDPETLERQIAALGLEVKGAVADTMNWGHTAVVWRPRSDSQIGGWSGFGETESEALCHAAARAFLGEQKDAAPQA
ncbi:MAG: hypothetical protein M3R02_10530 [Chloroflexota bacterium]|nr:hypothetical protein [Chloroflexota bacterium]